MDSKEASKIVHDRIMRLEPEENVARKIVGYIYWNDIPEQEMIRLALGPEQLILNLIEKFKTSYMLSSHSPISDPSFQYVPKSSSPLSSFAAFRVAPHYWEPQLAVEQRQQSVPPADIPFMFSDSIHHDEYSLQNYLSSEEPLELGSLRNSDFPADFYYPEAAFCGVNAEARRGPVNKICHYFNKGFCKHGSNCRYFHGQLYTDSYSPVFGLNSTNEIVGDDQLISPGSLEKLELEITELLKSKRGCPVSIASLPMIYYEKYGKTLQAEGYLTESQRHGKAGYSLTKLLARLKNSIRLIDRPHGQHSVILAEDAPKYLDSRTERNDPGPIVTDSHQIYLTFPAESTFTEEDVRNYFNAFGPVKDVRMPCQQKRMFGFVSFHSPDTAKSILSKRTPHYVCGARVLVKPYRERAKPVDRKYQDKFESQMCYHPDHIMDPDFQGRFQQPPRLRKNRIQDHEHEHEQALALALEFEARRLSQLQLAKNHISNSNQTCFSYYMNEFPEEDVSKLPSAEERLKHLLDVLNYGSTSDDDNNNKFFKDTINTTITDSPFIDQERRSKSP